jgi:hypothetical protein
MTTTGLHMRLLTLLAALCLSFSLDRSANAEALALPTGEVILTVSGKISNTNSDGVALFDTALLQTLPKHAFTTSTIWTEGVATYEGVLLSDLLAAVGASGQTVVATALNDYQISIPAADAKADGPLLAFLTDGAPMSARYKGPVWLVYPFDDVASYRTEQTYARSIWQLNRIEIAD